MGSCAPLRAAIGVRIVPPVAGHDSHSFTSARNAGSNSLVSFLFSKTPAGAPQNSRTRS